MNDSLRLELKDKFKLNEDQINVLAEEMGVDEPGDMALLDPGVLTGNLKMKPIPATKLLNYYKNLAAQNAAAEAAASTPAPTTGSTSLDSLPSVPDDSSFLEMLKVGGVLKVGPVDVISAMKAALANRVGLYNLPDVIQQKMEAYAESQDEPVGENFYRLQKLVASRSYGEILSALGAAGTFVSEKNKKKVLARLDEILWPALRDFNTLLTTWADNWSRGTANPQMAIALFAMSQVGGSGQILPPGMMQPPETTALRDAAEGVINAINRVFSGTGIPVARAMAYDAMRIKEVLEDPTLPAAVGATNREQMLKLLGVHVGTDYVRQERSLVRYALAVMELPKVAAGKEEYSYLAAMLQLGSTIPWDSLSNNVRILEEGGGVRRDGGFRRSSARETE